MRHYHSYDNRRGNTYGAGMKPGCDAHTRGWQAGVNVRVLVNELDQDEFYVTMTSGSSGHHASTFLGIVTDTKDGPRWTPSADAAPSRSARNAAARHELAGLREQISAARAELAAIPPRSKDENHPGIARHALQLAIDTLLAMDCMFSMCPGHAVPFVDMMTCSRCAAIQDLRAELARLGLVIVTETYQGDDT
jgi:hypothetical protein